MQIGNKLHNNTINYPSFNKKSIKYTPLIMTTITFNNLSNVSKKQDKNNKLKNSLQYSDLIVIEI